MLQKYRRWMWKILLRRYRIIMINTVTITTGKETVENVKRSSKASRFCICITLDIIWEKYSKETFYYSKICVGLYSVMKKKETRHLHSHNSNYPLNLTNALYSQLTTSQKLSRTSHKKLQIFAITSQSQRIRMNL